MSKECKNIAGYYKDLLTIFCGGSFQGKIYYCKECKKNANCDECVECGYINLKKPVHYNGKTYCQECYDAVPHDKCEQEKKK